MTSFDHIVLSSSRLSPGLLDVNSLNFKESLDQFCKSEDLADILPAIHRIIDQKTDLEIGYMMLRPECALGNSLPGFADITVFDRSPNNSAFEIKVQELGMELFSIVHDRNAKRARLNLGFILKPDSVSTPQKEFSRLCQAIAEESKTRRDSAAGARESFLGQMIHQVRNPLATILISASQMAMKTDDRFDDDDRMLVDFINSESEKIEYYLSQYSKYARAGKSEPGEIDAPGLINLVKAACGDDNLPADGISLTISASIVNLRIDLDSDQISCAIRELIRNAREASGTAKEKIHVSLRKEDKFIQIIICDNGPGIRPEMLRKVKEAFFSTKDGGSGLGLSIADKIIAAHAGRISIDSLPNRGTRVTVAIPCK